uniref:cation channel sperm-associated protein subunit zeta n=1 Tax=Jaculus jaculus TaxID=51337 RepID=UPI001E1B5BC7|nr:cation channel sperm-associated protein subunit zeta [Jaculus jaculus]
MLDLQPSAPVPPHLYRARRLCPSLFLERDPPHLPPCPPEACGETGVRWGRNHGGTVFQTPVCSHRFPCPTESPIQTGLVQDAQPSLPSPPAPVPFSLPPLASLVCDPQAGVRPSEHRRSSGRSLHSDVSNLWSTATLSQAQVDVPLDDVCENFDDDGREVGKLHSRTMSLKERFSLKLEDLTSLGQDGSHDSHANQALKMEFDKLNSESSTSISEHTPHRAYWEEQQNRLPLPLMEVMENEALEILTKALNSYKSKVGRTHFMTKELQRYIDGLRKRRNQRLYCIV